MKVNMTQGRVRILLLVLLVSVVFGANKALAGKGGGHDNKLNAQELLLLDLQANERANTTPVTQPGPGGFVPPGSGGNPNDK